MNTSKTRTSLEVPQRTSPATPRTARQSKAPGPDSDSVSSPNPANRTPKGSPKVVGRSPRSPASEKRPGRASELESQLANLQEELNKAKDQLSQSESCKKLAQQEAEDAKNQLSAMSAKLEESQNQLEEISASEEARLQELRKISQDRDRAWESELDAVQKHHSMDYAALTSAINEIQKLKIQLERVTESEAAQTRRAELADDEIKSVRMEMSGTFFMVEDLKIQLKDCKESEAKAQMELEKAKSTEEALKLERHKAVEAYKSLAAELEGSKSQIYRLEGLVSKLKADGVVDVEERNWENEESSQLKAELSQVKSEVDQLKFALEAAENRCREEYIQSTLQIRSAYELVEQEKSESFKREAEWEEKLMTANENIEELNKKLQEKESKLQNISEENEGLNSNITLKKSQSTEIESDHELVLNKSDIILGELKAKMSDKETELKIITEENDKLKVEIKKLVLERTQMNEEAISSTEMARLSESEALIKVDYLTEEADKSSWKVTRVTEQLDAAQAANSEMEAELRRLKIQSDQWRKAAEAAASILSTGNNNDGKFAQRTSSLDYHTTIGGKLNSRYSEDMDDELTKKKNGNMLKKIGVLLKKGSQK